MIDENGFIRCPDCGDHLRDCICDDDCICEIPFTGMNPDCDCQ